MSAAVHAIWRQALIERRARGGLALTWILLALAALGVASVALAMPQRAVLMAVFTAVPVGALLLMWWIYLCASVKDQCHPAALQLVPRLHQRIVAAVVVAWVAIVAIMTLLAGVPTGCAPQVAIVTALVLVETSFFGSARGLAIGAVLLLLPNLDARIGNWLIAVAAMPVAWWAGALLVVADGALALRRLRSRPRGAPVKAGMLVFLEQNARWPGGRRPGWFDRGADPQPAFLQPLWRSWLGGHWASACTVTLGCVAVHIWSAFKSPSEAAAFLASSRTVVAPVMLGLLALLAYMEAQRFARARTEQALLCLTPAAPARPALNRVMAGLLLAGFARTWIILWLLTVLALAVLGAPLGALMRVTAVWAGALVLLAVPLRDHSRAHAAPGYPVALLCAALAVAAAVAVAGHGAPGRWLAIGAVVCMAGSGLARWRWRAMLAAPPALPAGRVQDKPRVR